MYNNYLPFAGMIYVFSGLTGLFANKIVLYFNLDTNFKIFRFSNTWHYLFSGRIRKIKSNSSNITNTPAKVKYIYLDVLVNEKDTETTLYSGFLANYDLSFDVPNKIDRLYLIKANRYKKENDAELNKIKVTPRIIPGDIFTIQGDKILNINSTYLYYEESEVAGRVFERKKMAWTVYQIVIVILFLLLSMAILFNANWLGYQWYSKAISWSIAQRIYFIFHLNILLGTLTPFSINESRKKLEFDGSKLFFRNIAFLFILFLLAYIFSIYEF
jgi:hypothetical protein